MNNQLKELETKSAATYWAEICMAGDIAVAEQTIRKECFREGLCVTVTPTNFIYTGGEESGMLVRLINYPRFPKAPEEIEARAKDLAMKLMEECCQWSALILSQTKTEWINRRKDK